MLLKAQAVLRGSGEHTKRGCDNFVNRAICFVLQHMHNRWKAIDLKTRLALLGSYGMDAQDELRS